MVKITKNIFAEAGAEKGVRRGVIETAIQVVAQAKVLAPVDKGQLANSYMYITKEEDGAFNDDGAKEFAPENERLRRPNEDLVAFAGTNSDHWYPEFGTRFQIAQPHLRPAGEIAKGSSVKSVMEKFSREAMEEEFAKRRVVRKQIQ